MGDRKTALVVGATGVVGRNLLRHLLTLDDWRVIALSRRRPDVPGNYRHLALDLLDPAECRRQLTPELGITHVFYAAYLERGSWVETCPPNALMFRNLMDALEHAAPALAHVNLMQGSKWYGNHLGPYRTPAREDDPRHMPPNFYYDQQDLLAERQTGRRWTWSAARPHGICGFALKSPMNLLLVLAVYATISKALGLPLRHPGTPGNYTALYQVTDAQHLAKAVVWMATEPACANEAFNVTNGDRFRWEHMWPRIAEYFEMPTGPRQHIRLAEMMADKGSLWERIVAEHGLRPIPYDQLVSWAHGDFVFTPGFDVVSSLTKARRYGFHDVVDSEAMFCRLFEELRAERIIPRG